MEFYVSLVEIKSLNIDETYFMPRTEIFKMIKGSQDTKPREIVVLRICYHRKYKRKEE